MERPARAQRAAAPALLALACLLGGRPGVVGAEEVPPAAHPAGPVRIAFMPDVHFHDVYARFADGSFPGVENPANGRHATIRTMQAQLTSTRLFNENYFAFLAALDDAVARGVRLIALPGDFSDDGQPVHLRGLVQILDGYSQRHGVRFFAVPGNHDPVRPFGRAGGKLDFLGVSSTTGRPGAAQAFYSRGGNGDCSIPWSGEWARVGNSWCTDEMHTLGYAGITAFLAGHGFEPRPADHYYETPYSDYGYAAYDYRTALEQAGWDRRRSRICGSVEDSGGEGHCRMVVDATYLVEPVEGLWLVGLDANVYVPTGPGPEDFTGSGDQGYNAMLSHRPHVISWLANVVGRGEALGKRVVAFSHFPMTEFFNGASDDITALMGQGAMQLKRRPAEDTTRALAATGLRLHVGGHMHMGDVAVHASGTGEVLFNIQAPSLAAYAPGYTLMTLQGDDQVEVETVRLDRVPRFDELFSLYRAEHALGAKWDVSILEAVDYGDFVGRYLQELVRLRLLDEWPCDMRALVRERPTGEDLLVFSQLQTGFALAGLAQVKRLGGLSEAILACGSGGAREPDGIQANASIELAAARARADGIARGHGVRLEDFAAWDAMDLAVDFVRLANAGELAFDDIPASRLKQYEVLAEAVEGPLGTVHGQPVPGDIGDLVRTRFGALLRIMDRFSQGAPSRHFRIDLAQGRIDRVDVRP